MRHAGQAHAQGLATQLHSLCSSAPASSSSSRGAACTQHLPSHPSVPCPHSPTQSWGTSTPPFAPNPHTHDQLTMLAPASRLHPQCTMHISGNEGQAKSAAHTAAGLVRGSAGTHTAPCTPGALFLPISQCSAARPARHAAGSGQSAVQEPDAGSATTPSAQPQPGQRMLSHSTAHTSAASHRGTSCVMQHAAVASASRPAIAAPCNKARH